MIDRGLALLAAFDADHRSFSLTELAGRSGISVSSTFRLAARLVKWGALDRSANGRYTIGHRLKDVADLAP